MSGEIDNTSEDIGQHPLSAYSILLLLPKEQLTELYSGLRGYVLWLLKRRGNRKRLERFKKELADAEAKFREKTEKGVLWAR